MNDNILDHLGQSPPPPPPADLSRRVRRRLNGILTALHFLDLAVRGLPFAFLYFLQSMLAAGVFSLTGRYDAQSRPERSNSETTEPERNIP